MSINRADAFKLNDTTSRATDDVYRQWHWKCLLIGKEVLRKNESESYPWRSGRMKKSGFTFIEIMIVTIIIGLMASLGTLAITASVRNSRIRSAEAELEILSAAILQLAWDTGKWPNGKPRTAPGSVEMWDISGDNCGLLGNDGTYDNWEGPYYEGPTEDPWWTVSASQRKYFFDPDYRITAEDGTVQNAIVVGSFGPNGQGRNLYDSDDIYVRLDD